MTQKITRSNFLRGNFLRGNSPLRPPWSLAEADFIASCNQCGDCISRCPSGIIRRASGGYPAIEFEQGECTFCTECVNACKTGALNPELQPAWSVRAVLDTEKCLAYKAVECRSCSDPCETRAISMQYRVGAVAVPVIDTDSCSGCGACFAPCPVAAIAIRDPMEVAA